MGMVKEGTVCGNNKVMPTIKAVSIHCPYMLTFAQTQEWPLWIANLMHVIELDATLVDLLILKIAVVS